MAPPPDHSTPLRDMGDVRIIFSAPKNPYHLKLSVGGDIELLTWEGPKRAEDQSLCKELQEKRATLTIDRVFQMLNAEMTFGHDSGKNGGYQIFVEESQQTFPVIHTYCAQYKITYAKEIFSAKLSDERWQGKHCNGGPSLSDRYVYIAAWSSSPSSVRACDEDHFVLFCFDRVPRAGYGKRGPFPPVISRIRIKVLYALAEGQSFGMDEKIYYWQKKGGDACHLKEAKHLKT